MDQQDIQQFQQELDIDQVLEDIFNKKRIEEDTINLIIDRAQEIFLKEPNLIRLESPITIVGDLHGNFYNLMKIFDMCGGVDKINYLFLGNIGHKGIHALECFTLLFALKIKYPNKMNILRGYHDCYWLMIQHDFQGQIKRKKYSENLFEKIIKIVDSFSHAAVIENETFCSSSGISSDFDYIQQIENCSKNEVGQLQQSLYYLYTATPVEGQIGWALVGRGEMDFGNDITRSFLERNNLKNMVRSRQFMQNGYEYLHDQKIISIYSHPNLHSFNNLGAVLQFDESMTPTIKTFTEAIEVDEIEQNYPKEKEIIMGETDFNAFFWFNQNK